MPRAKKRVGRTTGVKRTRKRTKSRPAASRTTKGKQQATRKTTTGRKKK